MDSAPATLSRKRRVSARRHGLEPPILAAPSRRPGVVHLTAEYWPLARTGGLGEAVNGLATFQAAAGTPAVVVMPLYRSVRQAAPALKRVGASFSVTVGPRTEKARVYQLPASGAAPRVFLIEHPEFFDRPGIYADNGSDYPDNARRFAFFCLAALTALPQIAPDAQVLHAHDWHTALAPVYLRTVFGAHPFHGRLGTVLSVHNAGFQGHFPPATMSDLGLPPELFDWQAFEWYGRMNLLKGGLAFTDVAVTVSPTHARELRTPDGGFGLHEMFIALGDRLVGVLNGIDTGLWNPATDATITAKYSAEHLSGKRRCKVALQGAYGLPQCAQAPLLGMSARLVSQKGLDLVLGADLLSRTDAQFIFLGAGEHRYHQALAALADRAPERVAVEFAFSDRREHQLLAGADLLLMPSLYEPCGLTQMRAQRYGTIPVARGVGGLADSIENGDTGFLFDAYTPAALEEAVRAAVARYHDDIAWPAMMRRAMKQSFGWERSLVQYDTVYRRALATRLVQ
jgi:starch synthase